MKRTSLGRLLGLAVVGIGIGLVAYNWGAWHTEPPTPEVSYQSIRKADAASDVERELTALDETIWKKEQLAQEHERSFIKLWDRLRPAKDKYLPLAEFPFDSIAIGEAGEPTVMDKGILVRKFSPGGPTLNPQEWMAYLDEFKSQGIEIIETEWHHSKFEWDPPQPARSTVSFTLQVRQPKTDARYVVKGNLIVEWSDDTDADGDHIAAHIDAGNFEIHERRGPPMFESVMRIDPRRGDPPHSIAATIVYDLNHDGLPELILPGQNNVFWNKGNFEFEPERLLPGLPKGAIMGLVADLTGDGVVDLLASRPGAGLLLYPGNAEGKFTAAPQVIDAVPSDTLVVPMAVTAGDIDGDNDLDIWIGQWMDPYAAGGGKMPKDFYDANDSHPSYLLINDGEGHFADGTSSAGLAAKRNRRSFSSSFVDLDGDTDLDLVVVSDFAGVDVYLNDGAGHFTDETERLLDVPYNFGMSHTLADFNLDGKLDFFVIGMSSTTARRLESMGLNPPYRQDVTDMRSTMGYGNRMYLASEGRFAQAPFNDHVARSGWSWGSTAFDFDNDGDEDVYIGNGFHSGKSAKDYCTRFWCHDIYLGGEMTNPAVTDYFQGLQIFPEWSWNPFEKNCLFMNDSGRDFFEVGFLMDAAINCDARQTLSADLDADGHVDLIVAELLLAKQPNSSLLHVLRNLGPAEYSGNWIGVHLDDRTPGVSPFGAEVRVYTDDGFRMRPMVSGEGFMSQQPATRHFGLGKLTEVKALEVRWPNGAVTRLENPAINQYHWATAPAADPEATSQAQ